MHSNIAEPGGGEGTSRRNSTDYASPTAKLVSTESERTALASGNSDRSFSQRAKAYNFDTSPDGTGDRCVMA